MLDGALLGAERGSRRSCTTARELPHVSSSHILMLRHAACRSGHLEHMELIRDRCQRMLRSGAYLHWFFKYGFEEDEMHEALEHLRSYVEDASDFFGGVT